MNEKALRLLGLGRAAGHLALGSASVINAVKQKKCFLCLIADDCGGATMNKFVHLCTSNNIPYTTSFSKSTLGLAVGYDEKAVIGITDIHLYNGISAYLNI